jgi:hypothetical protein
MKAAEILYTEKQQLFKNISISANKYGGRTCE